MSKPLVVVTLFLMMSVSPARFTILAYNGQAQQAVQTTAVPKPQQSSQQPPAKTQTPPQPPQTRPQLRSILPSDFNVRIEPDQRMLIVMAAINVAGFDAEGAGQPLTPGRVEIRKDLANLDPQLRQRLNAFYLSHRRDGVEETADAMRYAALSLLMTEPPSFEIYVPHEVLPADLQLLMERDGKRSSELPALLSEFYVKSGVKQLLPKYARLAQTYAAAYQQPVSLAIEGVLNYFHTTPATIVNMRPLVIESGDAGDRG
ncbi:MAG TPA: hypothetical protein VFV34_15305, partial [Blastocatellia bacterium]|nr:hypothetical protein [Blastocatellia bacterium]